MEENPPGLAQRLHIAIATFFGAGFLPLAPGTWGSLAAAILYFAFLRPLPPLWFLALTGFVSAIGIYSSSAAEKILGEKDPGAVVIDEVAGQLLALVPLHFYQPATLPVLATSFVAFRVFDVLKPYPCNWLQDELPRGWGVMGDDLMAGVYAAIPTCLVAYWLA